MTDPRISYFCQGCQRWIAGHCDHSADLARIAALEAALAEAKAAGQQDVPGDAERVTEGAS